MKLLLLSIALAVFGVVVLGDVRNPLAAGLVGAMVASPLILSLNMYVYRNKGEQSKG